MQYFISNSKLEHPTALLCHHVSIDLDTHGARALTGQHGQETLATLIYLMGSHERTWRQKYTPVSMQARASAQAPCADVWKGLCH